MPHHTRTLRGSIEVLLEVERGSRTVVSMGRNGEDRGRLSKIGHLHLKVVLMKFMFTVIAKIHYLGLAQMVIRGASDGKASAYNVGDPGSIPGSGRSPGEGNGNPFQYSCLENPMDRGSW